MEWREDGPKQTKDISLSRTEWREDGHKQFPQNVFPKCLPFNVPASMGSRISRGIFGQFPRARLLGEAKGVL
jgi:hypothetical protein